MTWVGVAARLIIFWIAFLVILGPHAVSQRRGGTLSRWLPVALHRLFLRLFALRVAVEGSPPQGPALVVANHVSWLDIPVLGSLQPLSFVAKSEVAGWPVVGLFAKLQRCIFLDRARRGATADANARIAQRLAQGDVIVLFPEGTSSDGNRVLPFRSSLVGAARPALLGSTHRPVTLQPLAIVYERRNGLPLARHERPAVAWYGAMALVPHLAAFVRGGPLDAVVIWGEPILFDAQSDRKHLTAQAEAAVRAAIRRVAGPEGPNRSAARGVGARSIFFFRRNA